MWIKSIKEIMKFTFLVALTSMYDSYILAKNIFFKITSQSVSIDIKSYHEFCTLLGLRQLIIAPTRVTFSSSTIIDHILINLLERVTQSGDKYIGLSDETKLVCI